MNRGDITAGGLQTPDWCEPLLKPFGLNPFGENILRVVWGPRRLMLFGGYWQKSGNFEYRRVPKYGSKKLWMLERWIPAKNYGSPELWASQTCNGEGYLSIGPYPKYGVFEAVYLFATPAHEWLPLMPDIVLMTARGIWCNRIRKVWDIRNAMKSQDEMAEMKLDKDFEALWMETHGVRRGSSYSRNGVVQNNAAEIELRKERLALAAVQGVKVEREDFRPGFRQL